MVCRSTTRKSLTIATPGTQRSKTDRRFHRPAPSGQKQTAVFTTFGSAVKNRPPFSQLLAQRSKTDHRFHNFWPSGQKQTAVFTAFGSAVKNRPPFSPLLAQRSKTDRLFHHFWLSGQKQTAFSPLLAQRSKTDRLFHHFYPSDQKQTTDFAARHPAEKTAMIFEGEVGRTMPISSRTGCPSGASQPLAPQKKGRPQEPPLQFIFSYQSHYRASVHSLTR